MIENIPSSIDLELLATIVGTTMVACYLSKCGN